MMMITAVEIKVLVVGLIMLIILIHDANVYGVDYDGFADGKVLFRRVCSKLYIK